MKRKKKNQIPDINIEDTESNESEELKTYIKPVDIVNIDLNTVSEEFIDSIKWKVYHKYKELGGDGRIAKSPNFITYIDKIIGDNE